MQIIVGLGNPGAEYRNNRHNIGFMAIDAIAERHNYPPFKAKFNGLIADGSIDGNRVLLLKPQTFMNNSGDCVSKAAKFYKFETSDIIVIYDELDLTPGKVRVKIGGGTGGHNGLRSISPAIGESYKRVRLGIGHPGHKELVTRHVLGDFAKADAEWLTPLLDEIGREAGHLIKGDDAGFMNKLALALQQSAPPPKSAAKGKSHIRQAQKKKPSEPVPQTGPMAAMLKKIFDK